MPQKTKIPIEEKIRIVTSYLAGTYGYYEAAKVAGVSHSVFGNWVHQYKLNGPTIFIPVEGKTQYPPEIKKAAVEKYLSGKGSLQDICDRYHIRSYATLQKWIKVYNNHGTFKKITGGSSMVVGRQTIPAERVRIAEECISNGKNYGEIALKFEVSYQQVYRWVKKYIQMGKDGLQDRRGQRIGSLPSRTPEEELKARITQLEHEKNMLQMENDFLKKLDEVERRRR